MTQIELFAYFGLLFVFSVVVFVIAAGRKGLILSLFLAVFIPIDYVHRYFFDIPNFIRWLPFLAITLLGLIAVTLTGIRRTVPSIVVTIYAAIVTVSLISMLLNESGAATLFVSQRGFILIWASVAILWLALGYYTKDQLLRWFVVFAMGSGFVALFQRLVFVEIQGRSGDMVTGLTSVDGIYLYTQLIAISVLLAYWLQGKRLLPVDERFAVLWLIVSVAIGNNKAWVFFLPLLAGYMLISARNISLVRSSAVFGFLLVILTIGIVAFETAYDRSYANTNEESFSESITDPDYIRRYLFGGDEPHQKFAPSGQLLRGASVEFAYNLIKDEWLSLMIGLGPAAAQNSQLPGATGSIDSKYPGYFVGRVPLGMFLAEIGFVGLALQVLLLFAVYFISPQKFGDQPEHQAVRKAFAVSTGFFYIYENVYFDPVFALIFAIVLYPNSTVDRPRHVDQTDALSARQRL